MHFLGYNIYYCVDWYSELYTTIVNNSISRRIWYLVSSKYMQPVVCVTYDLLVYNI